MGGLTGSRFQHGRGNTALEFLRQACLENFFFPTSIQQPRKHANARLV